MLFSTILLITIVLADSNVEALSKSKTRKIDIEHVSKYIFIFTLFSLIFVFLKKHLKGTSIGY